MRISCSVEWLFIFFIIVIRFRSSLTKRKRKQNKHKTLKWVWFLVQNSTSLWEARDGAVARHQCGPGSNPGVDAICGLSLLLVLSFAPRGFSLGTPVFPSPQKPTFPNSTSTRNQVDEEQLCGCATSKLLFIYLFICTHTMFSGTHPFGPNKGVPPLPRQLPQRAIQGSVNVNLGL